MYFDLVRKLQAARWTGIRFIEESLNLRGMRALTDPRPQKCFPNFPPVKPQVRKNYHQDEYIYNYIYNIFDLYQKSLLIDILYEEVYVN